MTSDVPLPRRDKSASPVREPEAKRARIASPSEQPVASTSSPNKLPKRKVALLVGYCGTGYYGSQIQSELRTIEGAFFEGLVKAGCISKDNAESASKVGLARTARTDAGVHAAGNLFSLKLILQPTTLASSDNIVEHINRHLPDHLRVWACPRVTGGFNPRSNCDSRWYNYTLPTHVFLPPKPGTPMAARMAEKPLETFWNEQNPELIFADTLPARKLWRITPEKLDSLRTTLARYLGSHNFWNFTVGKDFRDRSAQRVMKQVIVSDPFLIDDAEWISIKLHGQSFMLHQIRKMIGLAILSVRTGTPSTLVLECFGPSRIAVPKAPSLGLLLEYPEFNNYNSRLDGLKANRQDEESGERQALRFSDHTAVMEKFKSEQIYPKIWSKEEEEATFATWVNFHDFVTTTEYDYLNGDGIIPASAIVRPDTHARKDKPPSASHGQAIDLSDDEDKHLTTKDPELEG
ncbi:uncharacterized protein L969DRAFT_53498 [Mixia osmundae IAM 14324]|uniref:tRNA pseudouridine synthase 1 n=1 Tax=Mixia osmundae (strain CBS 9802 / IAM 14324 / JCM 22182 / KY 12970) TaxID=764103 RepID=G7DSZ4_MIXOS|nr:uncharacterized protein L969DRAFT_53498 [Mixia osmundae IAM 14324]KEI37215.1 hypothetical protein L969DRAFT_53498 [Mixia osmundae IAM 14324]GAA93704.1 hypothetical protein E5Q_00349 [Mixia osmundae IAM 14324]